MINVEEHRQQIDLKSPFGELVVIALKMLTRTRKRVTKRAIRPCIPPSENSTIFNIWDFQLYQKGFFQGFNFFFWTRAHSITKRGIFNKQWNFKVHCQGAGICVKIRHILDISKTASGHLNQLSLDYNVPKKRSEYISSEREFWKTFKAAKRHHQASLNT